MNCYFNNWLRNAVKFWKSRHIILCLPARKNIIYVIFSSSFALKINLNLILSSSEGVVIYTHSSMKWIPSSNKTNDPYILIKYTGKYFIKGMKEKYNSTCATRQFLLQAIFQFHFPFAFCSPASCHNVRFKYQFVWKT